MPRANQQNIPLVDKINIAKGAANTSKFIDPAQLQQQLSQYDKDYYARSDADFAAQHPDLVSGRNALIHGAVAPLLGQGDPYLQGSLKEAGLGDVNLGSTVEQQAISQGVPIASKENRDRSYFANLLNGPLNNQFNMEKRPFGLSSEDVANVALTNAHQARINAQNKVQNQMNAALAGVQQQANTTGAIASGIGSIANSFINNVNKGGGFGSSFLSPSFYGSTVTPNTSTFDPSLGENVYSASSPAAGGASSGGW